MTQADVDKLTGLIGGSLGNQLGQAFFSLAVDGAIPLGQDATILLTKGTAGAYTLAAPSAAQVGRKLTLIAGSNAAHVVTSAAANIGDGTTGLNTTLTFAAFIGASVVIQANAANQWVVLALVAVTPAP